LNTELVAAEARRAEQTPNPDSMDLYFQGMAWLNKGQTPDHVAQARSFFDRALAADPGNVDALVGSARTDAVAGVNLFVADCMTVFAAADAKLTKPCRRSRTMPAAICTWDSSTFLRSARLRVSPNASMRWRWIEISPAPIKLLIMVWAE
jgi:hypothetical protein